MSTIRSNTGLVSSQGKRSRPRPLAQVATSGLLGDTFGLWQSYTVIILPAVGALTSASASGQYIQSGNIIFVNISATIVDVGSAGASTKIFFTLPQVTTVNGNLVLNWGDPFSPQFGPCVINLVNIGGIDYSAAACFKQPTSPTTLVASNNFYAVSGLYVIE